MSAARLTPRISKRYRFGKPARPEEVEALREDIRRRGILVPIELDPDGNVLDGALRLQISRELKITCPQKVLRDLTTDEARIEHVIKAKLLRAQPGLVSWGRMFRAFLEIRGIKRGQGSSASKRWADADSSQSATIADVSAELGIPERTARYRLNIADELEPYEDLADAVDTGEMPASEALREAKRRRPRPKLRAVPSLDDVDLASNVEVRGRDARDFYGDEDQADLAIFSPPYNVGIDYGETNDDALPHEEWLALLGDVNKILIEGYEVSRICINFPTGVGRRPYMPLLPDVLAVFEDLECACEGVIIWDKGTTGNRTSWGSWRSPTGPALRDRTELVVVFDTGHQLRGAKEALTKDDEGRRVSPYLSADRFTELTQDLWKIPPESAQRIGHPAPFPVELPKRLIQLYGWPGCTVIDPFAGSGSTGIAAVEIGGLNCILIDNNDDYVRLMLERLKKAGR